MKFNHQKRYQFGRCNPYWKGGKPRCKICNKEIGYASKYCQYCWAKIRFKKSENNAFYGKTHTKKAKSMISKKAKQRLKNPKNNPMYHKKGIGKYKEVKHHIDLNRENNKKNNLLFLTNSKHSKLHQFAYKYLVKTGQVKKYIKWFYKEILRKRGG